MVDRDKINHTLNLNFAIIGTYTIHADGTVDVQGDVRLKYSQSNGHIPVKFGKVSDTFSVIGKGIKSLENSPYSCGVMIASNNHLKDLKGAPITVKTNFYCEDNPLISMEGTPEHVGGTFWCTPQPYTPVLRLCMYDRLGFIGGSNGLSDIMKKYAGTGKPGAIKAAAELIKAGYKDNARW